MQENKRVKNANSVDTTEEVLYRIEQLLAQQNNLLLLMLTKGDLYKQGREEQIAALEKAGIRQVDIAKFFDITRQAVQNAVKKRKTRN